MLRSKVLVCLRICHSKGWVFIIVPTVIGSGPCEDDFKLPEAMAKHENEAAAAVHVKLELEQDRGALKCLMLLCFYPVASVNTL